MSITLSKRALADALSDLLEARALAEEATVGAKGIQLTRLLSVVARIDLVRLELCPLDPPTAAIAPAPGAKAKKRRK